MIADAPKNKILVVDDQPENIHVLIENLESKYEILFATDGLKALDIATSDNRPDLILLDIMMPGIDGYEVCRRLKAVDATSDIPIIFITAKPDEMDETEGFTLGAADYIIKPFRLPVVKARIQSVLRLKEEMDQRLLLARKLEDLNKNLEERIQGKTRQLLIANEHLKVSELKYRTIFENAIEGIFKSTLEGRLLDVSPSCAKILEYESAQSLIDENVNAVNLYHQPQDRQEWTRRLVEEGEVISFETRFKKKTGSIIWALLSAKGIRNPQGKITHYQGFFVDITEQKRVTELEQANTRLRELDSLKSSLLSTASHDMRSPMSAILGFNGMIKSMFSKNFIPLSQTNPELETVAGKIMDRFDIIENEGLRLIRMVNDFLDVSKLESGCSEWNDQSVLLNDVCKQAMRVVSGLDQTNRNVQLENTFAPDLPILKCDPDRLMQVMVNLLGNAAKFTQSGFIRVCTLAVPKNQIEVQIEDTGPGIPEIEQLKIFDKFHQIPHQISSLKDAPKGTGLGLTICKKIVEHYGGKIWVESEPGIGSTFIFRMPVNKGEAETLTL